MSPRKVRLVVDIIRGMDVDKALGQLKFVRKAAARPVTKLIESAVANAVNNFKLDAADLYVKAISVDAGPTLKRFRPRAHGRAASILKRTSHINVVLDTRGSEGTAQALSAAVVEKSDEKKADGKKKAVAKKAPAKVAKKAAKPAAKKAKKA